MNTIGLIGGTSYHSTLDYYRLINEKINKKLGAKNSASIILVSLNFEEVYNMVEERGWHVFLDQAEYHARQLQSAGADCVMLCANTLHMIAGSLEKRIDLPLVNIVEETARSIQSLGLKSVGLLGTGFTMEASFYPEVLEKKGISCLAPPKKEIDSLHEIIFRELTKGIVSKASKNEIIKIIEGLENRGAEGIILGCTELPMIIEEDDSVLKLFNTLEIHTDAAVHFALKN